MQSRLRPLLARLNITFGPVCLRYRRISYKANRYRNSGQSDPVLHFDPLRVRQLPQSPTSSQQAISNLLETSLPGASIGLQSRPIKMRLTFTSTTLTLVVTPASTTYSWLQSN